MIDSRLPVGRDCDCGHPMIWRCGRPVCAVYGSHPADNTDVMFGDAVERSIHLRNFNAPGARLVDELTALHPQASERDRRRAERHLQAV